MENPLKLRYYVFVETPDLIGGRYSGYWDLIPKRRYDQIKSKGLRRTKVESVTTP